VHATDANGKHSPAVPSQLISITLCRPKECFMTKIADPHPAGPTDAKQIAAFEEHIGHKLPPEYSEFLLTHNGGHPIPDAFTLTTDDGKPQEDLIMCFFPLRELSLGAVEVKKLKELHTWPLHCAWDDLQNDLENLYELELDPPLLPIGTDGSSNYICIVLAGERAGAVVFLDHETAEDWPLAPSFPVFLDSLRQREGTDYDPMFGSGR
jgi:cell wall assembly regulator SMI1